MEKTVMELPAKMPQGLNGKMRGAHVGLRTTDFEGTIHWYTEKLGFRVLQKWTVGNLQLAYLAPANDDNFWLEVLSEGLPDAQPTPSQPVSSGFHHLCLAVDDVDETLAALRERGVQVAREPFNVPPIGKRCGFITDLYGNIIEFTADLQ